MPHPTLVDQNQPVQWATISAAASAEVIAAVTGSKILVLGFFLVVTNAGTVQFRAGGAGGTIVVPAMPFGANGGIATPFFPFGAFSPTAASENLYMTLSGTGQVSGVICYQTIPTAW